MKKMKERRSKFLEQAQRQREAHVRERDGVLLLVAGRVLAGVYEAGHARIHHERVLSKE